MRLPALLPALAIAAAALQCFPLAAHAADSGLHTFYGEVVAIDPAKKILHVPLFSDHALATPNKSDAPETRPYLMNAEYSSVAAALRRRVPLPTPRRSEAATM